MELNQKNYQIEATSKKYNIFVVTTFILLIFWLVDAFVSEIWTHLKRYTLVDPALIISSIVFVLSLLSYSVAKRKKQKGYGLSVITLIISILLMLFTGISYYYQMQYFNKLKKQTNEKNNKVLLNIIGFVE